MDNKVQEKISQIQLVQHNMENFASQRQQLQIQETEIETALNEIKNDSSTYKIIGNIMIKTDSSTLKKDLEEKKELLTIRISTIEKQEDKLREQFENLQKEVMSELEKSKKKSKAE